MTAAAVARGIVERVLDAHVAGDDPRMRAAARAVRVERRRRARRRDAELGEALRRIEEDRVARLMAIKADS